MSGWEQSDWKASSWSGWHWQPSGWESSSSYWNSAPAENLVKEPEKTDPEKKLEELVKEPEETDPEKNRKLDQEGKWAWRRPNPRLWAHLFLFKRHPEFDLVPMLIGRGGKNMRSIHQATNAKMRIRGRGSGHLEVDGKREAPVPLMLAITSDKLAGQYAFKKAVDMAIERLQELAEHWQRFCFQRNLTREYAHGPMFSFGEISRGCEGLLRTLILKFPHPGGPKPVKAVTPGGVDPMDSAHGDDVAYVMIEDEVLTAPVVDSVVPVRYVQWMEAELALVHRQLEQQRIREQCQAQWLGMSGQECAWPYSSWTCTGDTAYEAHGCEIGGVDKTPWSLSDSTWAPSAASSSSSAAALAAQKPGRESDAELGTIMETAVADWIRQRCEEEDDESEEEDDE